MSELHFWSRRGEWYKTKHKEDAFDESVSELININITSTRTNNEEI